MTDVIGCAEAEQSLLGCLLRLPAVRVLKVAERLELDDLVDPANRVLLGATLAVAVAGHDPDPTLVVLELRRRGLERSFTSHQGAGMYALEVYGAAGVPGAVSGYLRGVLEHSYRRRVQEVGERLQQAAEANALDDLHDLVVEQHHLLRSAWQRLHPAPAVALAAEVSA